MREHCDNCGEKSYRGFCTNCHEEIYIEQQYIDLEMAIPESIGKKCEEIRREVKLKRDEI